MCQKQFKWVISASLHSRGRCRRDTRLRQVRPAACGLRAAGCGWPRGCWSGGNGDAATAACEQVAAAPGACSTWSGVT
jgi:hypothetical protein